MNLIKLKFLKNEIPTGRDYTYNSDVAVAVGDTVMIDEKKKGVVTDVDVPESEISGFADKVKTIAGLVAEQYRIIDILDSKTAETRKDGRYPMRIGRICKKPSLHIGVPMIVEYLKNMDGSDYSGYTLRTGRVVDVREKTGILEVETLNSIYIFEPYRE